MNRTSDKCGMFKHRIFKRCYIEIWHIVMILGIFKYIKPNIQMSYVSVGMTRDYILALISKCFLQEPGYAKAN